MRPSPCIRWTISSRRPGRSPFPSSRPGYSVSRLPKESPKGCWDAICTSVRLNHPLEILGILVTRVDRRNLVMNEAITQRLKEAFSDRLLGTQITVNTDLNKAQLAGMPIFAYANSSAGARDYRALADEIMSLTGHRSPAGSY